MPHCSGHIYTKFYRISKKFNSLRAVGRKVVSCCGSFMSPCSHTIQWKEEFHRGCKRSQVLWGNQEDESINISRREILAVKSRLKTHCVGKFGKVFHSLFFLRLNEQNKRVKTFSKKGSWKMCLFDADKFDIYANNCINPTHSSLIDCWNNKSPDNFSLSVQLAA